MCGWEKVWSREKLLFEIQKMIWACLSYNILYVTYFLTNFFDPKPVKRYLTWPNMKNANRLLFGCFKIIQNDSEILKT